MGGIHCAVGGATGGVVSALAVRRVKGRALTLGAAVGAGVSLILLLSGLAMLLGDAITELAWFVPIVVGAAASGALGSFIVRRSSK